jgi:hypothetical protein
LIDEPRELPIGKVFLLPVEALKLTSRQLRETEKVGSHLNTKSSGLEAKAFLEIRFGPFLFSIHDSIQSLIC